VLVLHLFGALPDLLVLDHGRRVVSSSLESCGEASRYTIGQEYSSPVRADETIASTPRTDEAGAGDDGELSFQRLLVARFAETESATLLTEARDTALRVITRERKRRARTREKIVVDLQGARSRERDRELGELLKGAFGQMRRGMKEIEVVDYFSTELGTQLVPLDPRLSPSANVDRYFRRYRKAKRGVPILESRLEQLDEEVAALAELDEEARECDDLDRMREIEARLKPYLRRRGRMRGDGSRRVKSGETKAQGPRRFVSADGWDILVGRNSRQNDELTVRIAHGNDVFLHVSGRPGAHVIIRSRPGKSVPQPTLLDAAQLAVYYSLPARTAGAFAVGATADVDYTQVKYVHKAKGARPGAVLLASHKSLRIKLEEEVIGRLRRDASGIDSEAGK
jgi:predicted ribosome quality control (RQC) complex YloA/Tae2 family protein